MLKNEQGDFPYNVGGATQIGRQLGHYTIVRKLGEGAAASVYEAEDSRIGRNVALKVLNRPESHDLERNEREISRFKREARTIARLSHPNIVTIYDIGEQDSDYYIVMECLAGMTLRERLDQGPIPTEETVLIISQIASVLDAIHARDIVHRDIKPSNVMLLPNTDPTRRDWVKLLDFGIARLAEDSTITHAGTLIGSPSYMSPEQVRGEPATKQSDIWALGVLLYEMLTGKPPFKAPTITSVLYQIDHESPEPLTGILAGVNSVIETALAKKPQFRYASAGVMASALGDALALTGLTIQEGAKPSAVPTAAAAAAQSPATESSKARTSATKPVRGGSADDTKRPYITAAVVLGLSVLALVGTAVITSIVGSRQSVGHSAQPSASPNHSSQKVAKPSAKPRVLPSPTASAKKLPARSASSPTPIASKPVPTPLPVVPTPAVFASPKASPKPHAPISTPSAAHIPAVQIGHKVSAATPTPRSSAPKISPSPAAVRTQATPAAPTPAPTQKPPEPTPASTPAEPALPTPGPIHRRPEPRQQGNPPAATASLSNSKVTSAHDLLGTWNGVIHNHAAKVAIRHSDGKDFSGEATIATATGSAHFVIAGDLTPDGEKMHIAFQSVRMLSDSTARDIDLGQDDGHLIDGGTMAGKGIDIHNMLYLWHLSR